MHYNPIRTIATKIVTSAVAASLVAPTAIKAQQSKPWTAPSTQAQFCAAASACNQPPLVKKAAKKRAAPAPVAASAPAPVAASAPAPVAASAPAPVAASAPAPVAASAPAQPQFGLAVFDASKPITLPVGRMLNGGVSPQAQAFVDESDCNYRGFWNALAHPLNAQCKENSATVSTTVVGALGVSPDGHPLFIANGPASLSESYNSRGTHGQGWLLPATAVAGVGIALKSLDYTRQSLNASKDLNKAINDGKVTSLFGSLNCGNAGVSGSTTGSVSANCIVNSSLVNSAVGFGNTVSGLASPTTTILPVTPLAGKFSAGLATLSQ